MGFKQIVEKVMIGDKEYDIAEEFYIVQYWEGRPNAPITGKAKFSYFDTPEKAWNHVEKEAKTQLKKRSKEFKSLAGPPPPGMAPPGGRELPGGPEFAAFMGNIHTQWYERGKPIRVSVTKFVSTHSGPSLGGRIISLSGSEIGKGKKFLSYLEVNETAVRVVILDPTESPLDIWVIATVTSIPGMR